MSAAGQQRKEVDSVSECLKRMDAREVREWSVREMRLLKLVKKLMFHRTEDVRQLARPLCGLPCSSAAPHGVDRRHLSVDGQEKPAAPRPLAPNRPSVCPGPVSDQGDEKALEINTESWEDIADDRNRWRSTLKNQLWIGEDKLSAAAAEKRARRKGTADQQTSISLHM
ncbi:uncharacterized protein LOC143285170 [Babylonia areolata]|uniref:uncharacterized protein LOC143285170 n=1 Tax=Babylonia areolata TaxID=304850 RepID=UPI003FD4F65D